ncbi:cullin family protein [Nitzschia inconspicua]|uniref:Cullin family protein n=1 Tax=Nitzschia inconspicua TaxID=303405 RepID=A0A9K3KYD7_9STRA|nr:cullin family protein [Nitzschia inconspicua]
MPRNKALMTKRATAPRKIIIKPFQKPPTLPPNYYEQTSCDLLEGTLNIIFSPEKQQQNQQHELSLQNSYQQVVNLVSHQYGPRLYQDLVATLQRACQDYVLPEDNDTLLVSSSSSNSNQASRLLGYIQTQYQKYVEYLLLCKHVFLPLDRAHGYTSNGTVVKRSAVGSTCMSLPIDSNNKSHNNNSSTAVIVMDLWQVGLEQFYKRLQQFQWDDLIYQKWWTSLQLDWDDDLALDQQTLLQSTLYMWQDLGVVALTLSQRLEPDLIGLFQSKSLQLQQQSSSFTMSSAKGDSGDTSMTADSSNYNATAVISYCFDKWMHVAYHWSRFLPKSTCVFLLENHLFRPHLTSEWLLNPKYFDPIVEEAFSSAALATPSAAMAAQAVAANTSSTTTTTSSSTIQQLWMLAGRIPGGYKLVGGAIAQYARSRGSALMTAMASPDNLKNSSSNRAAMAGKQKISDLLELQRQVRQLLSQLPHSAEYCQLKHVWEDVVNPSSDLEETNLVAEALAKYVDACLRDNKRQLLSSSSTSPLDNNGNWSEAVISGIFCYLQAKDVFEAFYKQDLAKRLLWNRIVSMDVERHFVSLLKAECGAGYTSKMEGMFQDMDWSRETMSRYKQTQFQDSAMGNSGSDGSNSYKLEVDIQVLTTGYWPVYPQYPNLNLPQSLLDPQEKFTEYYKSKYQGRRMTWQYALGHLVVKFKPKDNSGPKYELVVSLCQALTLLQFNESDELTLPQIMVGIGLEDRDEMERVLLSLSLGKEGTRVLIKRDHDAEKKKKTRMTVHDQDIFQVQSNFKSNQRRIRITNIMMKETKEDREKTVQGVSRDRLYLIDAVLVRIMKARKTILHQQLIPQVLEQVKVPAQPADIKKRIETLIEREYMERDSADRNRYNYLA